MKTVNFILCTVVAFTVMVGVNSASALPVIDDGIASYELGYELLQAARSGNEEKVKGLLERDFGNIMEVVFGFSEDSDGTMEVITFAELALEDAKRKNHIGIVQLMKKHIRNKNSGDQT